MERSGTLLLLASLYVAAEVVSNVTAGRLVQLGSLVVPGAIFLYAMTFTLRDAVHAAGGVAVARQVVWAGFLANLLLAAYGLLVVALPAPPWFDPAPYQVVLAQSARVVAASLAAYLTSQLVNTWAFERLRGALWLRSLGSNLLAVAVDSAVFISLAFAGTGAPLATMILAQVAVKLLVSALLLPLLYLVRGPRPA